MSDIKVSDFKGFFEAIGKLKAKQSSQKARGLNDYNMVNVARKASDEVGMHSSVIYSLINPNGLHYQGDLFLNLFIEHVLEIKDFGTVYEVQREEITLDKNKRIDFTIKSDKYFIGIEMKVNHHDSKNQLFDYRKDLLEKAKETGETVEIYYLTKDGKKASSYSSNGIKYIRISFKEHILKWIDACQKEVKNITNLNEAFENYKIVVHKITKKYKSKVIQMKDFLKEKGNNKFLKEVFEIKNSVHEILGDKLYELFQNIDEYVIDKCVLNDKKIEKIEKIKPSNKKESIKESIYDEGKCASWFYNNSKKTEYIGSFYKLTDTILLRVEVATCKLHIGLVSCKKDGDNYEVVKQTDELVKIVKNNNIDLEYRDWRRWLKWYSIDCGNFINPTEENQKCYTDFKQCSLKDTIDNLLSYFYENLCQSSKMINTQN